MDQRTRILHDLKATAMWVDAFTDIAAVAHSRNSDDDKFIHAALAANARWLVTGDQDLLSLKPLPNLQIVTPADALNAFVVPAVV